MMMIQELYRPTASPSTVASSHMAVQPTAPRLPPLASSHRATTGRAASSIHHLDIARWNQASQQQQQQTRQHPEQHHHHHQQQQRRRQQEQQQQHQQQQQEEVRQHPQYQQRHHHQPEQWQEHRHRHCHQGHHHHHQQQGHRPSPSACTSPATSTSSSTFSFVAPQQDLHHADRATDDAETGLGLEFGLGRPQSRDARSRINKSGFTRSRTGCLTCRAQKKKCDEAKPICTRCKNNQHQCRYPDQRAPVYGKARFAMERPPHRIVRTRQGWGDVAAPTTAMMATTTATAMATTWNIASFDRHRSSYVGARPADTPPDASRVTRENVELRHSPRSTAARHHPYRSLSASMLDRAAGEVDGHSSWKKAQQLGEKIAREPFRQLPPLSSLRPVASKPSPETVANMRLPPLSQPSPKLWSIPALSIPTSPASPPRSLLHPDPRAQRPSSARSSSTTASGNGDGANNKVVLPPISTFDRIIKLSAPRIF